MPQDTHPSDTHASPHNTQEINNNHPSVFSSPPSDPWLSIAPSHSHSNSNMDAELASIVSSLSALSNPSNTLTPGANVYPQGTTTSTNQLGGFRRNSFTASDIDSDIALSNAAAMSALSVGASANMDASPLIQRSTQSIGTAPPYTSNMFNINYKLLQGQGQQQQHAHMHTAPDAKSVGFALGPQSVQYRAAPQQYSQSVAGPFLQGYAQSQASRGGATGTGFFQQLGQSLVEGTMQLEQGASMSTSAASANASASVSASATTPAAFPGDEYVDYNSSGTAPNDTGLYSGPAPNDTGLYSGPAPNDTGLYSAPAQDMFYNAPANMMYSPDAPAFKPAQAPGVPMFYPPPGAVPQAFYQGEVPQGPGDAQLPLHSPLQSPQNMNMHPRNPYIYMQAPQMGSPPMNPEEQPADHAPTAKAKTHGKHRKNQAGPQANPYLDQQKQKTPHSKGGSGGSAAPPGGSPFSSKNSSHSSTSVSSDPEVPAPAAPSSKKKGANAQGGYHRSALLEDIRNYASNNGASAQGDGAKTYHLKDILGHTLEFCKDQYGSRFIQKELATASSSEREVLFNEIRDHAIMLSNDVFGNYVIQKFFEYGSTTQKDILVDQFRGNMKELSMQMYACRVIQKALEFISPTQRIELVDELKHCVLKMIKDQNGNHVIQKAIETIPIDLLPFVLKSLIGHIYHLSTHSYGCRVIQRLLEFGSEDDQRTILSELKDFIPYLIQDQYGNYVIQYILQHGSDRGSSDILRQTKQDVIDIISENVIEFSKHKFASNVVEKAVLYGTKEQKTLIISKILPRDKEHAMNLEDNAPMILMMRDQFANYVVQKLVTVTEGDGKKLIVIAIRAYLDKLNKSNSLGNRHLASVEKLAALVESVEI
ncbi:mRNA-binding protein [Maudiozyma humilis]|uniref:Pumilio homology domain family member 3 n=1 Tax=Maudiozyma humilis TaxID=51915 RepID=A0AAV5RVP3_MAUHU|nr:mRNA-binding protein [Kazachstania humilis]